MDIQYVSRAGEKLKHALTTFKISVTGAICADFGSSTGGFVDCLLQHGAAKVYAIETGYGVLDWKLRNDPRVTVMERTNAMHVILPEKVEIITVDTSWTRLEKIMPNAMANLKSTGYIIALVKPHYESDPKLIRKGRLPDEHIPDVMRRVGEGLRAMGLEILGEIESPILGAKKGNKEYLMYLKRSG